MNIKFQNSQLWFQEVIQPKLNQLQAWLESSAPWSELEAKKFFKELLSELELVQLDDYVVENCIEDILNAVKTLNHSALQGPTVNLQELARIAWLKQPFDRILFFSYWKTYRPFRKRNPDLSDSDLLNAYRLRQHLQTLITYVEKAQNTSNAVRESGDEDLLPLKRC